MTVRNQYNRRAIILFTLVIAGEVIFFLPFVLARIFRPTLLAYFDITNTELGRWFSVYGVIATGAAVGIVSFAGFTPEIFVSPLMGYLLDRNPGVVGHQHLFLLLVVFASIGLATSLIFNIFTRKLKSEAQNEHKDAE